MSHREDLPKKLSALPMARADLNRRIRELQDDETGTIEQLVGVTSRMIPGELPGGGSKDFSGRVADILVELDQRKYYVLALLEKYMQEDQEIRKLQIAIDQLPASKRQMIKQRYFAMMTVHELEEETGSDRTTIHRQITTALDLVYEYLQNEEKGE